MSLAWTQQPLWLLINILAAYRLTRLWVDDMVPPIPRIRAGIAEWAFRREDRREADALAADRSEYAHSTPRLHRHRRRLELAGGQPSLIYLIECYWCAGFWITLATVLAASLLPASIWGWVAVPLALSATTGLLARLAEKG